MGRTPDPRWVLDAVSEEVPPEVAAASLAAGLASMRRRQRCRRALRGGGVLLLVLLGWMGVANWRPDRSSENVAASSVSEASPVDGAVISSVRQVRTAQVPRAVVRVTPKPVDRVATRRNGVSVVTTPRTEVAGVDDQLFAALTTASSVTVVQVEGKGVFPVDEQGMRLTAWALLPGGKTRRLDSF